MTPCKPHQFSLRDQIDFARLSGDFNPIHVDPVAARRLLFGEPVVHGVNIVLWSLEQLLDRDSQHHRLESIQAVFLKPLRLHTRCHLEVRDHRAGPLKLTVRTETDVIARITLQWTTIPHPLEIPWSGSGNRRQTPAEPDQYHLSGEIFPHHDSLLIGKLFPNIARKLPSSQVASLLGTSYIIGMEAPGLHSLFTEMSLAFEEGPSPDRISYQTRSFDKRFSLLELTLAGTGVRGTLHALVRPAAFQQPGMATIMSRVDPDAFVGQRALVVGGSRGLGEVTAKLLASGGASVFLTYRDGQEEGERVAADITGHAREAVAGHFDCCAIDGPSAKAIRDWEPTHLYFFASPFIRTGRDDSFSAELFARFSAFYVIGLSDTVSAFAASLKALFYPSSIFVSDMPPHLREYATAKAAAEFLCGQMARRAARALAVATPRLPKMDTDQTVGPTEAIGTDTAGILLQALRDFAALPLPEPGR